MTTIEEVVSNAAYVDLSNEEAKQALIAALYSREDAACDVLRLAGLQFGLFPQIVAEVLAQAGLGSPISEEEREMIRSQFITLMDEMRRAQEEGGEAGV